MIQFLKERIKLFLFVKYESFLKSKDLYEKKKTMIQFKKIGEGFRPSTDYLIQNPHHIEVGSNLRFMQRFRLQAIDNYKDQYFSPSIIIGNNVSFNSDIHIGCINSIEIGDNCMFASRIYISDHNHGDTTIEMLKIIPDSRPLVSKGPIIIKNNVWVGQGVAILSGVTVGENAIIATNAVVTNDVPANSVVAGIPAKVIKVIN